MRASSSPGFHFYKKDFKNEEMKMLMNKNYWEGPTCQSRNKNHMGKTKYNTFLIKCVLQT
jgi:hypothetical protein